MICAWVASSQDVTLEARTVEIRNTTKPDACGQSRIRHSACDQGPKRCKQQPWTSESGATVLVPPLLQGAVGVSFAFVVA